MRIDSFDCFRGVAILFIVAGHCYSPWIINSIPEMVIANMISGGTALFVFISGFFFHHIFYPTFNMKLFLWKKTKNVLLPYVVLSALAYIIFMFFLGNSDQYITEDTNIVIGNTVMFFKYLWTGEILVAYWYIPFIMIIFSISPLFIFYIKQIKIVRLAIMFFLLAISSIIQRPFGNLSPIHSVIYFTPIYMIGILYSIHFERINDILKGRSTIFGILTIFISFTQVLYTGGFGNYHKQSMLGYNGIDIIIFQKIAMIFFFLSLFQNFKNKLALILKYLASVSFAIYFLHPWVLRSVIPILEDRLEIFLPGGVIFLIKVVLVTIISVLIATAIKKILKGNSRYLIGY